MEKYQILKPIGKGSYGDVFLVRHLIDRKQYVLKKIFIKKSSKEKVLAQQEVWGRIFYNLNYTNFYMQVKLLSELHHPSKPLLNLKRVFIYLIWDQILWNTKIHFSLIKGNICALLWLFVKGVIYSLAWRPKIKNIWVRRYVVQLILYSFTFIYFFSFFFFILFGLVLSNKWRYYKYSKLSIGLCRLPWHCTTCTSGGSCTATSRPRTLSSQRTASSN